LMGGPPAAGSISAPVLLAVAGCVVLRLRLLMLKVPLLLICASPDVAGSAAGSLGFSDFGVP
jgi:hypothetical protein